MKQTLTDRRRLFALMQLRRKARCGCVFWEKKTDSLLTLFVSKMRTTICDVHWLVDINEWWEGTEPPINVALFKRKPGFSRKTFLGFESFDQSSNQQTDWLKSYVRTIHLGVQVYGGSLGLLRVRRTARRTLAVKPRGMECRCLAPRNNYIVLRYIALNNSLLIYKLLVFILLNYY